MATRETSYRHRPRAYAVSHEGWKTGSSRLGMGRIKQGNPLDFQGEDANCCLTGLWRHGSKENTPSHTIGVEFESRVGSPNLSFLGLKVEKIDINQHSTTTTSHPHHSSTSHYSADRKNAVAAALTAPFISPAVAKGVKMKFKSSRYEIRW